MERATRAFADAWQKVVDDDDADDDDDDDGGGNDDEENTMCVRNLSCKCTPSQYRYCMNKLLEWWL